MLRVVNAVWTLHTYIRFSRVSYAARWSPVVCTRTRTLLVVCTGPVFITYLVVVACSNSARSPVIAVFTIVVPVRIGGRSSPFRGHIVRASTHWKTTLFVWPSVLILSRNDLPESAEA